MKNLNKNTEGIEIHIEALDEDASIEGNAIASGNEDLDKEVCDKIREDLNNGNEWAWCTVKVTIKYKEHIEAVDYLGCCSYKSEEDFKENSGYYEDMVNNCISDLNQQIKELCE